MKTVILFRPNSEHDRTVQDFLRDFKRQTGRTIPQLDVDSLEGIEICRIYDIVSYPAIVTTDNDGRVQQLWQGTFPTISELSYYA